MDWQQIISLMIVATSLVLLVRSDLKRRRRSKMRACGGDCCSSAKVLETTLRKSAKRN